MIAVVFALRDESRGFLPRLQNGGEAGSLEEPIYLGNLEGKEILVLHTGMGAAKAQRAVSAMLARWPVDAIISSGFAGGLDPAIPAGAVALATNGSNPDWLAAAVRALGEGACQGRFETVETVVESLEARSTLAKATGASVVEMEGRPIARLAREHGIAYLGLRVISDAAKEELAVPFSVCFDADTERPKIGALLTFLAKNPKRIGRFLRFVFGMGRLRATLGEALETALKAKPHREE